MNRAVVTLATAALVFLLAGCSGDEKAVMGSPTPLAGATEPSEAPLSANEPSQAPTAATPETAFLAKIREVLPDNTSIPNATDGQLLDAAREACEQLAEGRDFSEVSVIEGEQVNALGRYEDSVKIGSVARQTICP